MGGIHLNFIVEGQTEETFVKGKLRPYLADKSIWVPVRCVQTSRNRPDTTFISPPCLTCFASQIASLVMRMPWGADPWKRATALEDAMGNDIGESRLLPYIQVHEFEALVLADPQELSSHHPESVTGVKQLTEIAAGFPSPELINGGSETAPSKRIAQEIPSYAKRTSGPIIAARIGLPKPHEKCPYFGAWTNKLESLGLSI